MNCVQPFGTPCDKLANGIDGRYGGVHSLPQDEFGEDDVRSGYDRTHLQARNLKGIVQRVERTGHMGQEFLNSERITDYTSGDLYSITDVRHEEKLFL